MDNVHDEFRTKFKQTTAVHDEVIFWFLKEPKTHRLFQVDIDRREQCCAANYEQVVNHVVELFQVVTVEQCCNNYMLTILFIVGRTTCSRLLISTCFLIFQSADHIPQFLSYLNRQHPNIKFTSEVESSSTLPFLDISISRKNGVFETSVYRKPTFTAHRSVYQLP